MSGQEEGTQRSSQSPFSMDTLNWPNGSPSSVGTPTLAPATQFVHKVKRETEASEIRQNLQEWWNSASREY